MTRGTGASVFVATGAFSVGKSTTLRWLQEHRGAAVHAEAHPQVVASLGERSKGHPPDRPFRRIEDPAHFCPLCRPREFCDRVIALQRAIERNASPGDLLERGIFDPIEFYLRHTGAPASALDPGGAGSRSIDEQWRPVADYSRILLFEVVPEVQRPKWGKSAEERIAEAHAVEARLERIYSARGYDVVRIPPGNVAERAERISGIIKLR